MKFRMDELRAIIREAMVNAYEVLGVNKNSTPEEIKQAYRRKALELHPDRNLQMDPKIATANMVRVNAAREILFDPAKRSMLDRELSAQRPPSWSAQQQYQAQPKRPQPPPQPKKRSTKERNTPPAQNVPGFPGELMNRKLKFVSGKSSKFWNIIVVALDPVTHQAMVTWGRIGSPGRTAIYKFNSGIEAMEFANAKTREKLRKGYLYDVKTRAQAPKQAKAETPKAKTPDPRASNSTSGATEKTRKVYGPQGKFKVHTRVKGKAYGRRKDDPRGTQFKPNDQVNASQAGKGLKVKHPSTGWTQYWDSEDEK